MWGRHGMGCPCSEEKIFPNQQELELWSVRWSRVASWLWSSLSSAELGGRRFFLSELSPSLPASSPTWVSVVGLQWPLEVAPYLCQSQGHWVLAPRGGGRDGVSSTMLSQVDLATVGELQVEWQKRSETSHIDSFHDAPFRSPTPWISLLALSTHRPFENPNVWVSPQLSSWKGGARHGAAHSCREVLDL